MTKRVGKQWDGIHVGESGAGNRYYYSRHPRPPKNDAQEVTERLLVNSVAPCECDSKEIHADTAPYPLGGGGPAFYKLTANHLTFHGGGYGRESYGTYGTGPTTWEGPGGIPPSFYDDFIGSVPWRAFTTSVLEGINCQPGYTRFLPADGSHWFKISYSEVPAGATGLYYGVHVAAARASSVGKVIGLRMLVGGDPATTQAGQLLMTRTLFLDPENYYHDYDFVLPLSMLPGPGVQFWLGLVPLTFADRGVLKCGINMSEDTGENGGWTSGPSYEQYYQDRWLYWVGTVDTTGYVAADEGSDQWFSGVPVVYDAGGGSVYVPEDGATGYVGGTDGTAMTMTYTGAANNTALGEDADEDIGEPWNHEDGCRMLVAFRPETLVDAATAGVRGVTLRFNDGTGWVEAHYDFGDSSHAAGVRCVAEGQEVSVAATVVENRWHYLWLDTRNKASVVARGWSEADEDYPGSGEKTDLAVITRDPFYADAEDESAMEVIVNAGDGQVVVLTDPLAFGPAKDGQLVHEFAGSGDGVRTQVRASQPFVANTARLDIIGMDVRVVEDDRRLGLLTSVDGAAIPDDMRMVVAYACDRTKDDGTEDPTEDDTAGDPDT